MFLKENVTTVLGFKYIDKVNLLGDATPLEGDEVKISKTNIREHETTPPEYFLMKFVLKAMENPRTLFN